MRAGKCTAFDFQIKKSAPEVIQTTSKNGFTRNAVVEDKSAFVQMGALCFPTFAQNGIPGVFRRQSADWLVRMNNACS